MQRQRQRQWQLCYLLVLGILCFQMLVPRCSASKTFGIFDNVMGVLRGRPTAQMQEIKSQKRKSSSFDKDPERVVNMVQRSINDSRRRVSDLNCGTGNPIDDCWRCDPNWETNRQSLADCAIGFGRSALGGKNGQYYVVTDSSDNDPVNPTPGTLRHAVIQTEPLWIIFQSDMFIQLKEELIMNSYKTLDGRGVNVHIGQGPCITIHSISNIIIHNIHVHDCIPAGNAMVRDTPLHYAYRSISDGDGISIFSSSFIWIDHCELYNCKDGLIDATMGSTAITISNNLFHHHDKVMLLGHSDSHVEDQIMQVTIAFNHFGEGCVQRMPRCRFGYFHVVNNDYTHWEMYAIGGSAKPTINSEGNRYIAPADRNAKQVTKRLDAEDSEWQYWNWRTQGDLMLNGAYFIPSGAGAAENYMLASSLGAKPAFLVGTITGEAGVLQYRVEGTPGANTGIGGNMSVDGRITVSSAETSLSSNRILYAFICILCVVLRLQIWR